MSLGISDALILHMGVFMACSNESSEPVHQLQWWCTRCDSMWSSIWKVCTRREYRLPLYGGTICSSVIRIVSM